MDWALIEFEDSKRLGTNTMPPANEWPDVNAAPSAVAGEKVNGIASNETPAKGTAIYKKGARTGITTGEFNRTKNVIMHAQDARLGMNRSEEWVFHSSSGSPTPFDYSGDSGSFAVSEMAEFFGVSFAASITSTPTFDTDTYVTPAEVLFEEMETQFQGRYKFELA